MSHYVNSYYSTDMVDKFCAVYLSVIIVGKQTCVIPRDLRHTPSKRPVWPRGVQNDLPEIRIGVQVLNTIFRSRSTLSSRDVLLTVVDCYSERCD